MMHLEAIKERNKKPAPCADYRDPDKAMGWLAGEWCAQDIKREAVSPMASIDAAPLPEYMQGR